ncbi:Membrane protein [Streptococcus pneumoniae]|nr:Membrane protein [Streptococcus pneumoniae]
MELVLPNNYVVIDEEEMMYLDGGGLYIYPGGQLQEPLLVQHMQHMLH